MGPSAVLCTLAFVTCDGEPEKVFVQVSGTTKFVSEKEDTTSGGRSLKGGEYAREPRGRAGWTPWGPQPTALDSRGRCLVRRIQWGESGSLGPS